MLKMFKKGIYTALLFTSVTLINPKYVEASSNTIHISYDEEDTEYYEYINDNYGEYIENVCTTYGLDPLLFKALAAQEYGIEDNNIVQLSRPIWLEQTITAYNFDTKSYDTILIDDSYFKNPEKNILAGVMILQQDISYFKGNILMGLQSYNYGITATMKCVKEYAEAKDLQVEDVINDHYNIGWIDYVEEYKDGEYADNKYIYNVLENISYPQYSLYSLNEDNTENKLIIKNLNKIKIIHNKTY